MVVCTLSHHDAKLIHLACWSVPSQLEEGKGSRAKRTGCCGMSACTLACARIVLLLLPPPPPLLT